jgi:hypothetical protein
LKDSTDDELINAVDVNIVVRRDRDQRRWSHETDQKWDQI